MSRTTASTLFRFPKPILCIAADFQSGRGGENCTLFRPEPLILSFITPRGSVQSTASPLYVSWLVFVFALLVSTSTPVDNGNMETDATKCTNFMFCVNFHLILNTSISTVRKPLVCYMSDSKPISYVSCKVQIHRNTNGKIKFSINNNLYEGHVTWNNYIHKILQVHTTMKRSYIYNN